MPEPTRSSPFAGSWYPGEPRRLTALVDEHLARAGALEPEGSLVALISPHAGLVYSGPVAAHGYSLLRGRRRLTAVLVGPSHRVAFDGIAVWERGGFETPLGVAPIDEGLAERLITGCAVARAWPEPHLDEHCLEMQLPFLQRLVPELRIVPALMGSQRRGEVDALASALAELSRDADEPLLLVASSDLSHYHPASRAHALDGQVVGDVERFDPEGLMDRLERERGHACGGGPIVAVMKAARERGAVRARVLRYADSGDEGPRDKSRVVGYLSAALWADPGAA